jgi:Dof domain, zinc finger.
MYNRELQILETKFFIQKESLSCKFCDSKNTVCDGFYYYKVKRQNYLCKDCKRHFTAPLSSNIQSGEGELLET